jgi:hypothetical protein
MGGKSTFLRQNALIAVMAQTGLYVPAASATLGAVDHLFSRVRATHTHTHTHTHTCARTSDGRWGVQVGASDDLVNDRSTFMVRVAESGRCRVHAPVLTATRAGRDARDSGHLALRDVGVASAYMRTFLHGSWFRMHVLTDRGGLPGRR